MVSLVIYRARDEYKCRPHMHRVQWSRNIMWTRGAKVKDSFTKK